MKSLTKSQEKVLTAFNALFGKKGVCPSNDKLAAKIRMSAESVRRILWKLVALKLLKVNKKLKNRKFYL